MAEHETREKSLADGRPLFLDLSEGDLARFVESHGWPSYRAEQLLAWQLKGVSDVARMQNIPKTMKGALSDAFVLEPLTKLTLETSRDGTKKGLYRLQDGHAIETVLMRYGDHRSVCVSSQVGCAMGCAFCASTGLGFVRNLSLGELYAQVLLMQAESDQPISHVTVMGIGEPLLNLAALVPFIRRLADSKGLHISMRRITVSTCGLPDMMLKLANAALPINLAVSLHAPNQRLREQLMPIAKHVDLETLFDACRYWTDKTKRRITFEYALFDGVNDRDEDAMELADRLHGMLCHVNLIPANDVSGTPYRKSEATRVKRFLALLEKRRIAASVRRELGSDITAACGQLRRKRESWITP